jgi:hypothetical protein
LRSLEVESESDTKPYHLVHLDGAIQPTDRLSMRELARQLVKKGAIKLPKEGEEGALDFGQDDEMPGEAEDGDAVPIHLNGGGAKSEEELDEERLAVENAVLVSRKLCLLQSSTDSYTLMTVFDHQYHQHHLDPALYTFSFNKELASYHHTIII